METYNVTYTIFQKPLEVQLSLFYLSYVMILLVRIQDKPIASYRLSRDSKYPRNNVYKRGMSKGQHTDHCDVVAEFLSVIYSTFVHSLIHFIFALEFNRIQ